MGMSFVPVFLYAGSLSTSQIVAAQAHGAPFHLFGATLHYPSWFAVLLLPSFVIYVITMVGETNRLPFDLPEGEGELVGRLPHRVLLAEVRAVLPGRVRQHVHGVGAGDHAVPRRLARTVADLRSGRAPTPAGGRSCGSSRKLVAFMFFFIWLRGSLPRIRYDQLMAAGLEDPDPGRPGLDPADRDAAGLAPPGRQHGGLPGRRRDRARPAARWRSLGASPRSGPPSARGPGGERRRPSRTARQLPGAADGPAALPRHVVRAACADRPGSPGFRDKGGHRCLTSSTRSRGSASPSGQMFHKVDTVEYPEVQEADRAAVPRPAPAQPVARRPGEVHRLRAVRLGLPGRRHLRRGRQQHRVRAVLARRAVRCRLPDQLPALHPVRPVRRGLPDQGADHDQRLRDGRRQPGEPDLDQGAAGRAAPAGHGGTAASDAARRYRRGLLPARAVVRRRAADGPAEHARAEPRGGCRAARRHAAEGSEPPADAGGT